MTTEADTIARLRDHLEFDAGQWRELAAALGCDEDDACLHCHCLGVAATVDAELAALEEVTTCPAPEPRR